MSDDKWHDRYLESAKHFSTWSKDPSRQIGTVIVDPSTKRILSTGYNGFPRGIADTEERLNNREVKYKYVVHSEMNAIFNASFSGVCLAGADIYVYGLPVCNECAKGIIQVGIRRVFILTEGEVPENWLESWKTTQILFEEAGILSEWKQR